MNDIDRCFRFHISVTKQSDIVTYKTRFLFFSGLLSSAPWAKNIHINFEVVLITQVAPLKYLTTKDIST